MANFAAGSIKLLSPFATSRGKLMNDQLVAKVSLMLNVLKNVISAIKRVFSRSRFCLDSRGRGYPSL